MSQGLGSIAAALGAVCLLGQAGAGGPKIPRERIPSKAPTLVRRYIERMYSLDPVTRAYGAVYLGRMGDRAEAAVPFLIAMLGDDVRLEWEVRDADPANPLGEARKRILGFYKEHQTSPGREAARALGRICAKAPDELLAALRDENASTRRHAAEALGLIRDKKATKPLIPLLKDKDPDVRARAAWALGRLRDPAAVEALVAAAKDPKRAVRRAVVTALGEIKDPRGLDALLAALLDTVDVSAAAEAALMETRDLRAVEPLIVSLKHRKEEVRRVSARLLGAIGDRRAVRPLIRALEDRASDVRFEALTALRKLSGEDFGPDPKAWSRWYELEAAAKQVEEKIAGEPVHAYIAALRDPNWAVRAYGAKMLGLLGDKRATTSLRGSLWDKDAMVRRYAAESLGALGDPQAVEALIAALSDADPQVQEAAEGALRRITGAKFGRDVTKWQEWWDENQRAVFLRYRADRQAAEARARALEEGEPAPGATDRGTLALLAILGLLAALPVVILVLGRMLKPR